MRRKFLQYFSNKICSSPHLASSYETKIFLEPKNENFLELPLEIYQKSIEDINNTYKEFFGFLSEKQLTEKDKVTVQNFFMVLTKAKKTLESLLRTYDYGDSTVIPLRYEEILSFGIERYNESLFVYEEQDTIFLKYMLNDFKVSYTIFFKFSDSKLEEDDIASAQIIYSAATPKLGLITLKNNIPSSKLTSKYLEPLMLHLFTHLLGFQSNDKHDIDTMLDENASKFYISTNNVLEYAKNYFGDTEIDKIEILKDMCINEILFCLIKSGIK